MGLGGNAGEKKAARKGTGHHATQSRWPRKTSLAGASPKHGSYMGLTSTFESTKSCKIAGLLENQLY